MHLLEKPEHCTNLLWSEKQKERKEGEEKAQHPAGIEPTTSQGFAREAQPLSYFRCSANFKTPKELRLIISNGLSEEKCL